MNGTTFRMPARRWATVATAAALAAGAVTPAAASSALAAGDHGRAAAVVLRTGLDVSLVNRTVHVPFAVSLNEVRAPHTAARTALTARLDGVGGGRPFPVLGADVASAKTTATATRAEATVHLAHARLHVPGLPLLSLVELDTVTARATCEPGRTPVAASAVPGTVTVLGKRVTLTAGGPTDVRVPGVGQVRLDLSQRETTSRTAAATALRLTVSVNPLKLNVAEVEGTVTLAGATCETPAAPHKTPHRTPAPDIKPQAAPARTGLAETGANSLTPYLAAGSAVLLAAGGGAVALVRRRKN
ncbi:SCO1860 family LAETG-anchored protein [Streptomyces sp. NPDC004542]|uniref:SCO1860 family LAETG-anchored protein n=1 Tax=Streptomyces sp. NPDC004542 TaxID=3154281 RepID=UPI0033AA7DA7